MERKSLAISFVERRATMASNICSTSDDLDAIEMNVELERLEHNDVP